MFERQVLETKRVVSIEAVDVTRASTIWIAAFQMYATFGSRQGGVHAALVCAMFVEEGQSARAAAWDAVCGAIRELRRSAQDL
jgi:hypothetical protein